MSNKYSKIARVTHNKDARVLVSNFTWLAVLKAVGYIFPLITLPYLSRVIGVDSFGEIAFAASIMVFIETFTDFGFNYTATREVARKRENIETVSKIFSDVMWAKIILMILGFGILCALIYTIPSLYDKRLLLLLTFLYIPGHIIFPDWFFQAMEKMKYITILNVISKIVFTALIFVVIKEKQDYVLQPLLTAFGYWVSGIVAMWFIIKKFQVKIMRPRINDIWSSIKGSWNIFVSLIFPNLYTNLSTIILRSTSGDVATGLYSAGDRFIGVLRQLSHVLSRTFYPFLARRIDAHKIYVFISGSFALLASLFLYIGANLLVKLFYTPEFAQASSVIKILSISPIGLFLMDTYGTNYLVIMGKDKVYKKITIAFSLLGLTASLSLIPEYSYIGMAITVSSARIIGGILTYLYAEAHKNKSKKQKVYS
jgi:PST family polysaccharide transporter